MSGLATLLLGVGLVLAIEGLVLALAPRRIDQIFDLVRGMTSEARRTLGLTALALGVILIWLAGLLGG